MVKPVATLAVVACLLATIAPRSVHADITSPGELMCPKADIWGAKIVTDVCWSCLFPMKILGVKTFGSGRVPPGSSNAAICMCPDPLGIPEFGITIGMWMPQRMIELVRKPFCSPTLNTTLAEGFRGWGRRDGGDSADNQFYNYHYFAYPLIEILELLIAPECNAGGYTDFDLLYMSEYDPTWNEDALAMFTNPEAALSANPLMMASCPVDCAAATFGSPLDTMWWCVGCWGNLYPFTGNVPSGGSMPRVTSLLATRATAALHRRGLAWKTVGDGALCGANIFPMLPKTQYRLSQFYPLSEASNTPGTPPRATSAPTGNAQIDGFSYDQNCCHNMGVPQMLWGEWRNIPATGEDAIHMQFRWTDCCLR